MLWCLALFDLIGNVCWSQSWMNYLQQIIYLINVVLFSVHELSTNRFFPTNSFIIQNCSTNAFCKCLSGPFLSLFLWKIMVIQEEFLQWDSRNLNVLFWCSFDWGKNNLFSIGYLLYLLKMWIVQQLFLFIDRILGGKGLLDHLL